MITLGILLIILGLIFSYPLLWIGIVLFILGVLFNFGPGPWVGSGPRRRRWY